MFQLVILLLSTGLLVVWGGGLFATPLYLAAAVLAAGSLIQACRPGGGPVTLPRWLLLGFAAAIVAWLAIGIAPLPEKMTAQLGQERSQLYASVADAHEQAAELGLAPARQPRFYLSLNRAGSSRILLLTIAMFAAAYLASTMSRQRKELFLRLLVLLGAVVAVGGLFARYVSNPKNTLWWVFEFESAATSTTRLAGDAVGSMGCFVNANHFGAFLALLTPAAAVMAIRDIRQREWERLLVWVAVLALYVAGIAASGSRGACLLLTVSFPAIGLMFANRENLRSTIGVAVLALGLGGLMVAMLGGPTMDQELRSITETPLSVRAKTWKQCTRTWDDFPWLGVGAEGFRTISTRYESIVTKRYAHHAESAYLQLLADGGVVGCLLFGGLAVCYCLVAWNSLRTRRRRRAVRVAAGAGVGAILLHGVYDFPFHIPIYGVVAAIMLGLFLSPARRRDEDYPETPWYRSWRVLPRALAPLLALALVVIVWRQLGNDIRERDRFSYVLEADAAAVLETMTWTPASYLNWYCLSQAAFKRRNWRAFAFAEHCLSRATELAPLNVHLWAALADARRTLGDNEGAAEAAERHETLSDMAKSQPVMWRP